MLNLGNVEFDMYTGIIAGKFKVKKIVDTEGLRSFIVELNKDLIYGLSLGASVSVNGVCFTVTKVEGLNVGFDAMQETLDKTTISDIKEEDFVNIERSAKIGDEIGGHTMSGHVSTMANIINIKTSQNNKVMTFKVDNDWMKYIFSKGFIGLDGASLTVVNAQKEDGLFDIHFIPETLRNTCFGDKQVGDRVNLEIDPSTQTIVDTVERYLENKI